MFNYEYVSTVDGKGKGHNYKLATGETLPDGHVETDRRPAQRVRLEREARFTRLR